MNNDKIWETIALNLAGEASPKQMKQLENWREQNQANELLYKNLYQIWQQKKAQNPRFDSQKAFEQLSQKIQNT
jgi:ferric-dicitrate binding protein FerR (iron transport regulator)